MGRALRRCTWAGKDPLYVEYHDAEWGVPAHDDRRFFEMLILEGAQAGLAWITILRKREGYRRAFADFDPEKVARFRKPRIERLLQNPEIVRNRKKVESAVGNARAFLKLCVEFGSFDAYIWERVGRSPLQNRWRKHSEVPPETEESRDLSRDLRKRGFSFVGPTICYAFMQAAGMVNDHLVTCFRYDQVS